MLEDQLRVLSEEEIISELVTMGGMPRWQTCHLVVDVVV